ncbi:uncharacterized protein LOC120339403 [Styela clava]|uniref:uncharacterized protein LOC120339403 n=1 Tax=Styela clava TaxID=7725 RepID=UPI00193AA0DF|nr:uncharacterized protein LOC120339403 [Styela clava]
MLRSFKCINRVLKPSKNTVLNSVKRLSSTQLQSSQLEDDDMPVSMENPFKPEIKRCLLCGVRVDYKNVQLLSQFVSSVTGVPLTQKSSGLCDKKYKDVIKKIHISRVSGFMAYRTKESVFLNDPDITDRSMYTRRRERMIERGGMANEKSPSSGPDEWELNELEEVKDSSSSDDVFDSDIYALDSDVPQRKDRTKKKWKTSKMGDSSRTILTQSDD